MTLIQFAEQFRQLLVKAEQAGHDVDNIGETADAVLQANWDTPITTQDIPDFTGEQP